MNYWQGLLSHASLSFPCFATSLHPHLTISHVLHKHLTPISPSPLVLFMFISIHKFTIKLRCHCEFYCQPFFQNPQFTNPSISFIIDISFVPIISSSIIVIATSFVDNASSHTTIVSCLDISLSPKALPPTLLHVLPSQFHIPHHCLLHSLFHIHDQLLSCKEEFLEQKAKKLQRKEIPKIVENRQQQAKIKKTN